MQTLPSIRRFGRRNFRALRNAGCLAAVLVATGCGSTAPPSLNGSWSMQAISNLLPSEPPQAFNGTLSSSGTSLTGILYFNNSCFGSQPLQFSGSVDSEDLLKITSKAYNNQVVFLTGNVSTDGGLVTSGSYTVSASDSSQASCDNGDNGNLSGARIATLQGTFAGNLNSSVTKTAYPATAQLTQAASARNGVADITGSFDLSGWPCFTSGSVTTGALVGNALEFTATSGSATLTVQATIDSAAQNITVTGYTLSGSSCTADSGTGSLTQQ